MRSKIQAELSDPTDELFVELQTAAYGSMLFDLFPRFYEACKETPVKENVSKVRHRPRMLFTTERPKHDREPETSVSHVNYAPRLNTQITDSTMLADVLKSQSFEVHLFAEYCKEQLCEEQVRV